jgi:soluble lytic murein transglycosylase
MDRAPANAVIAYLPLRWPAALRAAAAETGVDPWLLAGVARQESAFTAHARSPRNALGVMQLLQGTARGHAHAVGLSRRPDLLDPELNIRIGARELVRLLGRFGAVEPALAAYNAGETRVRRWWSAQPDRRLFTETIPIQETYNYIRRVSYLSEAYRLVWADQWEEGP